MSGTSKQHVANDYAQRLAAGVAAAQPMVAAALAARAPGAAELALEVRIYLMGVLALTAVWRMKWKLNEAVVSSSCRTTVWCTRMLIRSI